MQSCSQLTWSGQGNQGTVGIKPRLCTHNKLNIFYTTNGHVNPKAAKPNPSSRILLLFPWKSFISSGITSNTLFKTFHAPREIRNGFLWIPRQVNLVIILREQCNVMEMTHMHPLLYFSSTRTFYHRIEFSHGVWSSYTLLHRQIMKVADDRNCYCFLRFKFSFQLSLCT